MIYIFSKDKILDIIRQNRPALPHTILQFYCITRLAHPSADSPQTAEHSRTVKIGKICSDLSAECISEGKEACEASSVSSAQGTCAGAVTF